MLLMFTGPSESCTRYHCCCYLKSSYRPVSLIPVFCKIFEKVLLNRVTTKFQLRHIDFPSNQQNGYAYRFKNHILPSYDMSLAQNLNSVDTYTWALTLLGAALLTMLETTFLQVTFNLFIKCINIYLALLNNTNS